MYGKVFVSEPWKEGTVVLSSLNEQCSLRTGLLALLGARTLLGAKGIATSNKCLTSSSKCIASSNNATFYSFRLLHMITSMSPSVRTLKVLRSTVGFPPKHVFFFNHFLLARHLLLLVRHLLLVAFLLLVRPGAPFVAFLFYFSEWVSGIVLELRPSSPGDHIEL